MDSSLKTKYHKMVHKKIAKFSRDNFMGLACLKFFTLRREELLEAPTVKIEKNFKHVSPKDYIAGMRKEMHQY